VKSLAGQSVFTSLENDTIASRVPTGSTSISARIPALTYSSLSPHIDPERSITSVSATLALTCSNDMPLLKPSCSTTSGAMLAVP
jgi:hypothetical protein